MNTNAEFMDMEEAIFKFAQELYFKNQVASDLVEKDEQKDLLHLDRSGVEKLQEIDRIIKDFCQPQIRAILQVSQNAHTLQPDFKLVKNQTHQLIQNYDNLKKLVQFRKKIRAEKNKKLSSEWLELENNLEKMNITKIENIEKSVIENEDK